MLQTYTLKNGIKVATYSIPQMKSAFLAIVAKGGAFLDSPETCGAAHFMEHLLVEGIPSFPNVESFSDFIESLAGSYNAFTNRLEVKFVLNAPAKNLPVMVNIASEVFFQPLFPEDAIERERQAILEEIKQRQDSLGYKINRFFAQTRYRAGHPMLLDIGGSQESVSRLSREDLLKYWQELFSPKNTYLVIVGGLDNRSAKRVIDNTFSKFKSTKPFPGFPKLTNADMSGKAIAIREDQELKSCYINLSFPSISDENGVEEGAVQMVIKNILGGLSRSRLFRLLRQRKGLVYDVGISSASYPNFGYVDIHCQTSKEKLEEVLDLIAKELSAFVNSGPTKEEVEFAKNYTINRILMAFDHPSRIEDWVEGELMWEKKIYTPEEYTQLIKAVTFEDIIALMKKYWEFDKLNLTVQGPVKNSPANLKKFKSLTSIIKI